MNVDNTHNSNTRIHTNEDTNMRLQGREIKIYTPYSHKQARSFHGAGTKLMIVFSLDWILRHAYAYAHNSHILAILPLAIVSSTVWPYIRPGPFKFVSIEITAVLCLGRKSVRSYVFRVNAN